MKIWMASVLKSFDNDVQSFISYLNKKSNECMPDANKTPIIKAG